ALVAMTLYSQAGLGTGASAQAATVTDTFRVRATGKEGCQGNPKLFENISVRIHPKDPTKNSTLTITRDPLNTGDLTDIQAKVNNTGSADIDAITMKGLAFPRK